MGRREAERRAAKKARAESGSSAEVKLDTSGTDPLLGTHTAAANGIRKNGLKQPSGSKVDSTKPQVQPKKDDKQASECYTRLCNHSKYLDSLLSMVDPKFYFTPDPEQTAKKFQKHVKKANQVPKHQLKLAAKERKKARLNTTEQLTVPEHQQLQSRLEEQADDDDDDDGDDAVVVGGAASLESRPMERLSVAELRSRLADRLDQLRASRGGNADPKPKATKKAPKPHERAPKHNPGPRAKADTDATADAANDAANDEKPRVDFNKLATSARGEAGANKRKMSTAELLAAAEERQRKQRARMAEADGGDEVRIDEWQRAFEKAGGIKKKDDPKLLKKTLKRKERQKKKSSTEWKARIKNQLSEQSEAQEKRRVNLAARMTKSKAKVARQKQRENKGGGGRRPGFEGKNSFLN